MNHNIRGVIVMANTNFLSGTWEDFESWIKAKVGSEISWKIKPRDTKVNRMVVAKSILETMERSGDTFPSSGNIYLELDTDGQRS